MELSDGYLLTHVPHGDWEGTCVPVFPEDQSGHAHRGRLSRGQPTRLVPHVPSETLQAASPVAPPLLPPRPHRVLGRPIVGVVLTRPELPVPTPVSVTRVPTSPHPSEPPRDPVHSHGCPPSPFRVPLTTRGRELGVDTGNVCFPRS